MYSSCNNVPSCKHKLNCFYLEKRDFSCAFLQPFKEKENKNIFEWSMCIASMPESQGKYWSCTTCSTFFPSLSAFFIILNKTTIWRLKVMNELYIFINSTQQQQSLYCFVYIKWKYFSCKLRLFLLRKLFLVCNS